MSITLRKQYSAKYQVLELTTEVEDYEKLQVESANFDAIAEKELKKMVDLVNSFDTDSKDQPIVVAQAPTTKADPITPNQKMTLEKNKAKVKLVATELNIPWKDDLSFTKKEAMEIIKKLYEDRAKTSAGF